MRPYTYISFHLLSSIVFLLLIFSWCFCIDWDVLFEKSSWLTHSFTFAMMLVFTSFRFLEWKFFETYPWWAWRQTAPYIVSMMGLEEANRIQYGVGISAQHSPLSLFHHDINSPTLNISPWHQFTDLRHVLHYNILRKQVSHQNYQTEPKSRRKQHSSPMKSVSPKKQWVKTCVPWNMQCAAK